MDLSTEGQGYQAHHRRGARRAQEAARGGPVSDTASRLPPPVHMCYACMLYFPFYLYESTCIMALGASSSRASLVGSQALFRPNKMQEHSNPIAYKGSIHYGTHLKTMQKDRTAIRTRKGSRLSHRAGRGKGEGPWVGRWVEVGRVEVESARCPCEQVDSTAQRSSRLTNTPLGTCGPGRILTLWS